MVACLGAPAYLMGEPAEDGVENLPGVSDVFIERGVLRLHRHRGRGCDSLDWTVSVSSWEAGIHLVRDVDADDALSVRVLMAWTAHRSGQIRHTEIRPNAATPAASQRKERD